MLEDANKAVVKKTFTKSEQDYSENDISLMKTQRICPAMHRSIEVSLSEGQKKLLENASPKLRTMSFTRTPALFSSRSFD